MSTNATVKSNTTATLPIREADNNLDPQVVSVLQLLSTAHDKLDKALTTTLHGDLWEGSKAANATRHIQLAGAFEIRAGIEQAQALVNKLVREKQEEEGSKKMTKPNGAMTAMVRELVAQQVEVQMRDTKIELARVKEDFEKEKHKNKMLADKLESVEVKSKKAASKPVNVAEAVRVLRENVAELQQESRSLKAELQAQAELAKRFAHGLEERQSSQSSDLIMRDNPHKIANISNELHQVRDKAKALSKRVGQLERAPQATMRTLEPNVQVNHYYPSRQGEGDNEEELEELREETDRRIDMVHSRMDTIERLYDSLCSLVDKVQAEDCKEITRLGRAVEELQKS